MTTPAASLVELEFTSAELVTLRTAAAVGGQTIQEFFRDATRTFVTERRSHPKPPDEKV